MPRAPRVSAPEIVHHVINRCNHQEKLLSRSDLQDCCALLLEAKKRFGIRIFAYALLQNHYHLMMQESAVGLLSKAMHWFNGSTAMRFNIRHDSKGHLWQGRFRNRVIESDQDLLCCLLYIELNPARAGLAPNVTDWPFCSVRSHASGAPDPLLDIFPLKLEGYSKLLSTEWNRTQELRQAIERSDREAVKNWLRRIPSINFIPFRKEIARLVGRNHRQWVGLSKKKEKVPGTYSSTSTPCKSA